MLTAGPLGLPADALRAPRSSGHLLTRMGRRGLGMTLISLGPATPGAPVAVWTACLRGPWGLCRMLASRPARPAPARTGRNKFQELRRGNGLL
jgi:hypothetical protein